MKYFKIFDGLGVNRPLLYHKEILSLKNIHLKRGNESVYLFSRFIFVGMRWVNGTL